MYAIYESREVSLLEQQEDDPFLDPEEAEEIIRQLQRDNPSLYQHIAKSRDGLRCGTDTLDGAKTFVFCRAGQYHGMYLLDEQGEVISREIPYILRQIQCDAAKPARILPNSHNSTVTHIRHIFEQEVRTRASESQRAVALNVGQRYILEELRKQYMFTADDEITLTQIDVLESAFRRPLPQVLLKQLNDLKRHQASGQTLVNTLLDLYAKFNLAQYTLLAGQEEEGPTIPRIICSEALL